MTRRKNPMKNKNIKILFWGSSDFSVFVLEKMEKCGILPSAVITSPDKPKGRNLIMTPPPVKIWADNKKIKIYQPEKLKDFEIEGDFDLAIVASYGKIIPERLLDKPTHKTINIHPSLLPLHRGPSPIQYSILNGDTETGVSIMLLDKEMDHGPLLGIEKISLDNNKYTFRELEESLANLGGKMICDLLSDWMNDKITPYEQDHSKATFTKKIEKEDGSIDPKLILVGGTKEKVELAERKIRAFNPDPGTFTIIETKNKKTLRVKILSAKIEENLHLDVSRPSKLIPEKVIPEGKKEMTWEDFKRGNL